MTPLSPFLSSLFFMLPLARTQTHSHKLTQLVRIFYVFLHLCVSVMPACGLTYSRVQNERERGGLGAVFLYSSDKSGSARASRCSGSLQTDTRLLQGLSHVQLLQQSQTHSPCKLNTAIVSRCLLSLHLWLALVSLTPLDFYNHIIAFLHSPAVRKEVSLIQTCKTALFKASHL